MSGKKRICKIISVIKNTHFYEYPLTIEKDLILGVHIIGLQPTAEDTRNFLLLIQITSNFNPNGLKVGTLG